MTRLHCLLYLLLYPRRLDFDVTLLLLFSSLLSPILSQLDDVERNDLILRFRREGLSPSIPDDKKLPHVWRWLGDAETNCLSLRNQIDKLYKQQERDIKVSVSLSFALSLK